MSPFSSIEIEAKLSKTDFIKCWQGEPKPSSRLDTVGEV